MSETQRTVTVPVFVKPIRTLTHTFTVFIPIIIFTLVFIYKYAHINIENKLKNVPYSP